MSNGSYRGNVDGMGPTGNGRRPRGSLTPDSIVEAAVEIMDEGGLANLTMAAVARSLDVPVTSVHWHFRTRDELLDSLAERVTADLYSALPPVAPDGQWDEEFLGYFSSFRRQLLGNRSFMELSLDRGGELFTDLSVRRRITERLEAEVGLLVRAGVPAAEAYRFYNVCSNYVRGFVILEIAHTRSRRPLTDEDLRFLDPELFPVMSQVPDLGALTWFDADRQFRLGLELLVEAIATRISELAESPGTPKEPPRSG